MPLFVLTYSVDFALWQHCPVRFLRKHNLLAVFWDCFCLEFACPSCRRGSQSCKLHF
jgi:hypothetical protein